MHMPALHNTHIGPATHTRTTHGAAHVAVQGTMQLRASAGAGACGRRAAAPFARGPLLLRPQRPALVGAGRARPRAAAPQRVRSGSTAAPAHGPGAGMTSMHAAQVAEAVAAEDDEPQFFFTESLVRSFLLGIGAGVVCESAHVLFNFLGLAVEAGTHDITEFITRNLEAFAPLLVWDHVAALGCWVMLYIVEAIAIASVLENYPDNSLEAAKVIRGMATLPKRLLPVRLADVKRSLYSALSARRGGPAPALAAPSTAGRAAPAAAAAAATAAFVDAPVEDALADIRARARAPLPPLPGALPAPPAPAPAPGTRPGSAAPRMRARRAAQQLRPGQLDPGSLLGRRQQEALDRRSYLHNFWYAAALSEAVPVGRPTGADLLGSRVVLFRDPDQQQRLVALDDACPHRGAPLSRGWLARGAHSGHTCVVCPYHGWEFDAEGRVAGMPSTEPGRWPRRPLLSKYPVQEAGGFVWLFFGDQALPAEERPPLPALPLPAAAAAAAPGSAAAWHVVHGELPFAAGHWGVFDAALELGQLAGQLAGQDGPGGVGVECARDTFEVVTRFSVPVTPASPLWGWCDAEAVSVTARAMLPSSLSIEMDLGGGGALAALVNTTPVNDQHSVNRYVLMHNFQGGGGAADAIARAALFKLLGEDVARVEASSASRLAGVDEGVGPQLHHGARRRGGVGGADPGAQVRAAFRALRQEWMAMGYGALPETLVPRRTLADQ